MKFYLMLVIVFVMALLFGVPDFAKNSPRGLSKDEIAKLVESTLRSGKYLEGTARVSIIWPPLQERDAPIPDDASQVLIKFSMAPDKLQTTIYQRGKEVAKYSLEKGRYFERYSSGEPADYAAPIPHGTDSLEIGSELACRVSGYVHSWVGVPANEFPHNVDKAGSMRMKIDMGEQEADALEAGHDCYVFRCKEQFPSKLGAPQDIVQSVIYVDKGTFLVVRWDTIYDLWQEQRIRQNDMKLTADPPKRSIN